MAAVRASGEKAAIARRFGRAARSYDGAALVQRAMAEAVAAELARRVPHARRVLELGCGSGALTERLLLRLPAAHVTAVDFAPPMLAVAAERLPAARVRLLEADVETWEPAGRFDAVVSCALLQWVADAPALVARHGRPGVHATFGPATLRELRAALAAAGSAPCEPPYPDAAAWRAAFPRAAVEARLVRVAHGGARGLLRSLRATGAGWAPEPAPVAALRRAVDLYAAPHATYETILVSV